MTLEEWEQKANHSDRVIQDILADWEKDREELLNQRNKFIDILEKLAKVSITMSEALMIYETKT